MNENELNARIERFSSLFTAGDTYLLPNGVHVHAATASMPGSNVPLFWQLTPTIRFYAVDWYGKVMVYTAAIDTTGETKLTPADSSIDPRDIRPLL